MGTPDGQPMPMGRAEVRSGGGPTRSAPAEGVARCGLHVGESTVFPTYSNTYRTWIRGLSPAAGGLGVQGRAGGVSIAAVFSGATL